MNTEIDEDVLLAFTTYNDGLPNHPPGSITVKPIPGGLINHTYKIECERRPPFLLQQINKHVFNRPQDVQENYITIWQFAEFEFTGLRLPAPVYCGRMTTLFVDEKDNYWRAFEFIDGTKMLSVAETDRQAGATAKAFARFTAAFSDFNIHQLKKVIPGFHDINARYEQLGAATHSEAYERLAKALPLINEFEKRERYKHFYEIITESEEFPVRVMHHDAKIANVLFSRKNGRVICPVDFDTIMPGYFFSDLGDMIRSMTCSLDENSIDFDKITIRKDFYKAIVDNYMSVMEKHFTSAEKKYVHYAGLLMVYMQAMRFLTDYLNGDVYYRIAYPDQNFDRAKNQLVLLQRLEEFLSKEYGFTV
jgi:thiamine kinase-like enzyme